MRTDFWNHPVFFSVEAFYSMADETLAVGKIKLKKPSFFPLNGTASPPTIIKNIFFGGGRGLP